MCFWLKPDKWEECLFGMISQCFAVYSKCFRRFWWIYKKFKWKKIQNFSSGSVISNSLLSKLSIRFQNHVTQTASHYIQYHKVSDCKKLYLFILQLKKNNSECNSSVRQCSTNWVLFTAPGLWKNCWWFEDSWLSLSTQSCSLGSCALSSLLVWKSQMGKQGGQTPAISYPSTGRGTMSLETSKAKMKQHGPQLSKNRDADKVV